MSDHPPPKSVRQQRKTILFLSAVLGGLLVLSIGVGALRHSKTSGSTRNFHPPFIRNIPEISISSLSQDPWTFDGRIVSVRASIAMGWEGDNYLFDPLRHRGNTFADDEPRIWFYCRPGNEKVACGPASFGSSNMAGNFIGYFHFVPNSEGRANAMFDPGPLQLEIIGATETGSEE